MDKISLKFTFKLDNNETRDVVIKDVNANASETQISALGDKLIEKGSQFNGSVFQSIVKVVKITTIEEIL